MMPDSVRDAVLAEALSDIPADGFTDAVLARAAEKAGVGKRERLDAFPNGPASLVEAFSHWADARMAETMAQNTSERMRERVSQAVMARIAALEPHKDAARRAAVFLALPQHAVLAARLSMRTVDRMWRAAGDRSSDFSYYTKRAMLGAVYASTLLYWLSDSSEGNRDSWAFLDHRIADVMRLEQWRGAARDAVSKLPNPLDILASLRGERR
jgi:ubiquinone biosynthesis protein COQ9